MDNSEGLPLLQFNLTSWIPSTFPYMTLFLVTPPKEDGIENLHFTEVNTEA